MSGILIAAPTSGAGKTTLTLGILRALSRRGVDVQPAKSGPDYIDPAFHTAACGRDSLNLDAWAMPSAMLHTLAGQGRPLVVEGAMGLFDGAGTQGSGSSHALAQSLGLDLVLVLDCTHAAHSIAVLAEGFVAAAGLRCAGVILNRVGSARHLQMLRTACAGRGIPVLGHMMRDAALALPDRHLGLVQAREHPRLDAWLTHAASLVEATIDLRPFLALSPRLRIDMPAPKPPAQSIAIADDLAFSFTYPHHLHLWRAAGAEVAFFSPLADDPVPKADLIVLPGGYAELHAGRLASNHTFLNSLRTAAQSTQVYGECSGYMVLGDGLMDADGVRHQMAGLLRLETSFAKRKLHLGYRHLTTAEGLFGQHHFKAHEFHYATTLTAQGQALFHATDADGHSLPDMGLRQGRVAGSFAHII